MSVSKVAMGLEDTLSRPSLNHQPEVQRAVPLEGYTEPCVTGWERHHDEGNAYARLGEVFTRLGRRDEARTAYERGIEQAERYSYSGMAEDLRQALGQTGG